MLHFLVLVVTNVYFYLEGIEDQLHTLENFWQKIKNMLIRNITSLTWNAEEKISTHTSCFNVYIDMLQTDLICKKQFQ